MRAQALRGSRIRQDFPCGVVAESFPGGGRRGGAPAWRPQPADGGSDLNAASIRRWPVPFGLGGKAGRWRQGIASFRRLSDGTTQIVASGIGLLNSSRMLFDTRSGNFGLSLHSDVALRAKDEL